MTDPEGAQSGATDPDVQSGAGGDDGSNTDTGTSNDGGTGGSSGTGSTGAETVSRTEYEAIVNRLRAADRRRQEFEDQLKQIRDKDLPEAEKLKRDYAEAQATVEKLSTTNRELALKVAFLSDNTYSWHNAERALRLVDMSQLEIQDDGSVRGLKDALKALATSDPYLIKQEVKETNTAPAGTAPGNNGASGNNKPTTKGLEARIPALRTRVPRS
jgi:hypothetical protein